jgi:ABC-type transport system involved in multi-copper enzyme maturation permease subunit
VSAELRKLVGLRAMWVAVGAALLPAPAIALLNVAGALAAIRDGRNDGSDAGFYELAFGAVSAVILGVTAMSSEYTSGGEDSAASRQIVTTLTSVPSRWRLLAGKAGALVVVVSVVALVTAALTLTVTRIGLGAHAAPLGALAPRVAGVVVYWVLMALLAFAIATLTRSGVVPLAVLIVNSSVVSIGQLLTKVTPVATYLPDTAGARMFIHHVGSPVDIAPLTGGLVMAAWVLALLAVAAVAFHRRDA